MGYIGFVPPQIMVWDKKNLEGKVFAEDITETAKKLVPQMKKEGADVIVAIPHSGISTDPYKLGAENSVYYLTEVEGIDAIAFGHSHAVFPGKDFAKLQGVDNAKGTINGVTAVMPGRWGSHVGVMDLMLKEKDGKWQVWLKVNLKRALSSIKLTRNLWQKPIKASWMHLLMTIKAHVNSSTSQSVKQMM